MDFDDKFNSNNSNGEHSEGCKDIPNGFQEMDPKIFTLIGGVLGDALAGSLPLNIQNAMGNWLCLVGQAMLAFAAQQAYFESGPGRCYHDKNKNITNPFCPNDTSNISNLSPNSAKGSNATNNGSSNGNNKSEDVETLSKSVNDLLREVNELKKEIRDIKKNKM